MDRSPELENRTRELYGALERGDSDFVVALIADDADALVIGTDPREWWSGHDEIAELWGQQAKETAGIKLVSSELHGYESGDVGWVADQPAIELPDGTRIPLRVTGVFRRENGDWMLAQWHASMGIANEEAWGDELTTG